MKVFRIQNERCHACCGCEYSGSHYQDKDDFGYRGEIVHTCSYCPTEDKYIVLDHPYGPTDKDPCFWDDVVILNDEEEQEIISSINNPDMLYETMEESVFYNDMIGDKAFVSEAIEEYYKKEIEGDE
jgi:hypothetical protein